MSTQLTVKDMMPTLSLNQYFLNKIESVLEKYGHEKKDYTLQVLVSEDSHRTAHRAPHFECRLVLRMRRQRSPFIITQNHGDFFTCAKSVADILEKKLRRASSRKTDIKRKRVPVSDVELF